jgi:hypothetical protein
MKFSLSQDFPAGLDRLWQVFGRPDYPERKYRSLGSSDIRLLRFTAGTEVIEVELERGVPMTWQAIPVWARPFLGRRQVLLRHHTRWQRVSPSWVEAQLDIAPAGRRVSAHGTGSIVQLTPDLTRMTLRFTVESAIPVLGARAARLYAKLIREAMRADHAFTLDYLMERAPRSA